MTKGEQTRQRILETAAPIFNRRGFKGCSLHELMQATGLEKGGIYRHFASKEELAAEAFRYALAHSNRLKAPDLSAIAGAPEKLRCTVRRFVSTPSDIAGGCPLMNTAIDADDGNPVLRELAREGLRAWRQRLCTILEDGLNRGEIRPGVEPRAVANTLISTLEGALMLSRIEGSRTALKDAAQSLESLIDSLEPA